MSLSAVVSTVEFFRVVVWIHTSVSFSLFPDLLAM